MDDQTGHNWACNFRAIFDKKIFLDPTLKIMAKDSRNSVRVCKWIESTIFMEWAELVHLGSDSAAYRHFHYLFDTFESDPRLYNLYAYNITNNRYEYLDGTV